MKNPYAIVIVHAVIYKKILSVLSLNNLITAFWSGVNGWKKKFYSLYLRKDVVVTRFPLK